MSKASTKIGVGFRAETGQLSFTFGFFPRDDAQGTEDNGSMASDVSVEVVTRPERELAPLIGASALPSGKRKWHSLYDKVFALPNLTAAWRAVASNKGASGLDGMTIRKFSDGADERLLQLHADLRQKTYRPRAVRRVYIPKNGGGKRPLGIPTVRDRIVHQAVKQILEPIFEAKFSSRSHGFRPALGCGTALEVVDKAIARGYTWVVDADIKAFFDTVDHETLLTLLNEEVADGSVLRLIRQILKAGVVEPGVAEIDPTELGTPQGSPLSPLLANVYLHAFDTALVQAGYGLIRYADDFVIFAKSEGEAEAALTLSRQILEGQLGLRLHPEKTRVVSVASGFEFLGFHYFRDPKTGRDCKEVRGKSVRTFRAAVRERTPRLKTQRPVKAKHVTYNRLAKNQRIGPMIEDLNRFLQGWHGYFKGMRSRYDSGFNTFDGFVRRRVRAAVTGRCGNGWWNQIITNAVLRKLGLIPLCELELVYQQGLLASPARKG